MNRSFNFFLITCLSLILLASIASSAASTVSTGDVLILKAYADAFNQSRNYMAASGPAEQTCLTSGTFLAYHPCHDLPTCTETANLVCTVSGSQGCAVDILAADILDYKNGVDKLNAAYSMFTAGYDSFSQNNAASSLSQMNNAFEAMKNAADNVSQNKLRYPEKISCACTNPADCCLGRCAEARFNYTAISLGEAQITNITLKKCTDGTQGGSCSANQPAQCVIGQLVNNSAKCGCPSNMKAAADGKSCTFIPCLDHGIPVPALACSSITISKKCENGTLVDKASECGCPSGMKASGNTCAYPSCMDNGISVPESACSTKTIGKKCENGLLVDKAIECGCPQGQKPLGNVCACPVVYSQICNVANVTKYHDVVYVFDRGMQKSVNESYTFEQTSCYPAQKTFAGANCAQLINSTVNDTPTFVSPEPNPTTVKAISCSRCPAICTRNQPLGLQCGSCSCPANLGFCNTPNARVNITGTPAYCTQELLKLQKDDNAACASNFECKTNECRNAVCYNRQKDVLQLIFDWFSKLF